MDAQNHLQNPGTHKEPGPDYKESGRASLLKLIKYARDLWPFGIEKTMPRGLNSKEETWGRAGDKLL